MKYDFPDEINRRAKFLIEICREKKVRLSTIESCTGGLLSGCLTDIAGSSEVLDRAFVTYSNESKHEEVGVSNYYLKNFGAVSDIVAREMCAGAMRRNGVGAAVSLTGIAGPGGGTITKPVGLVFIGVATNAAPPSSRRYIFSGDRQEVRSAAIVEALDLVTVAIAAI